LLAAHFLDRFTTAFGTRVRGFTREATEALLEHSWPGNVRELENRVQRATLLAGGPYATRQDLGLDPAGSAVEAAVEGLVPFPRLQQARAKSSEHFEQAYVTEALRHTKGHVTRAAALAGVSKQMFRRLMRRHAIDRRQFLAGLD
jgi:two-component system NtrC family response regulator